jgi:hypothetical protein
MPLARAISPRALAIKAASPFASSMQASRNNVPKFPYLPSPRILHPIFCGKNPLDTQNPFSYTLRELCPIKQKIKSNKQISFEVVKL